MNHVAVLVGHDLDFNMAHTFAEFLDIDVRITEAGLRFSASHGKSIGQGCRRVNHLHAASATAGSGLDNDRVTDLGGDLLRFICRLHPFGRAGQNRHARFGHRLPGADLIPHQPHALRRRTDKGNSAIPADFREIGVFRQKPVTGMNGAGVCDFGRADDGLDIEVTMRTGCRADADALIGQLNMQ